jgi:hypothetical protein
MTPPSRFARSGSPSAGGTDDWRTQAFSLGSQKLGLAAAAVDYDPLLLVDLAISLLGCANRRACEGACTESRLARGLVDNIACWKETSWRTVLNLLAARLEAEHFEQDVLDDLWTLPEIDA